MNPVWVVVLSWLAGVAARAYLLRVDYRQYPSYPQGYAIHLSVGVIAAFLGALALPALVAGEFAAASFLALAATQFREVRRIEREALAHLEEAELVRRGPAYIEGIARVFEARNYLAMLVALLVSAALEVVRPGPVPAVALAAAVTAVSLATLGRAARGITVGDIAAIRSGRVEFDGPLMTVEGAVLTNVGLPAARESFRKLALAAVIEPRGPAAAATLANPGQRQAILHDVAARLGVRMDLDEPEFAPLARRLVQTDAVVVVVVPQHGDFAALAQAIRSVPVLEASVRLPRGRAGPLPGPRAAGSLVPRRLEAGPLASRGGETA